MCAACELVFVPLFHAVASFVLPCCILRRPIEREFGETIVDITAVLCSARVGCGSPYLKYNNTIVLLSYICHDSPWTASQQLRGCYSTSTVLLLSLFNWHYRTAIYGPSRVMCETSRSANLPPFYYRRSDATCKRQRQTERKRIMTGRAWQFAPFIATSSSAHRQYAMRYATQTRRTRVLT